MKKILVALILGISGLAVAAVAPSTQEQIKKPQVTRPDMTKRQIIRKEVPVRKQTDAVDMQELSRYKRTLTKDNVDAVENMARLMQDDPGALFAQMGVETTTDSVGQTSSYQKTPENASPAERLAALQPPSLTNNISGVRLTKEGMERLHQQALQNVEQIGRPQLGQKQLGQKQAPIMQTMTVEEIKNSGIDVRYLPENWEEIVRQNQEQNRQKRRQRLQPNQKSSTSSQ